MIAHERCHAYGHSWEPLTFEKEGYSERQRPLFGIREIVQCGRCTTTRSALFSSVTGKRLTAYKYERPTDYSPTEKMSRSQVKVEIYRRIR